MLSIKTMTSPAAKPAAKMVPHMRWFRNLRLAVAVLLFTTLFSIALLCTTTAHAQTHSINATPVIGLVEFYGAGKLPKDKLNAALGAKVGDPLPASKADVEERINAVPGVVESHLEAVCCDAGKMILYVGVEERGAPRFDVREAPEGEAKLPLEVLSVYRSYLEAVARASTTSGNATGNNITRDLSRGYPVSSDPLSREIQMKFPGLATEYITDIREVLRNSYDEEQRAAAALVAGYNIGPAGETKDARKIGAAITDLQFALRDADAGVRATAVDGLTALIVYARLHPEEKLETEPTWLVQMLNSLSWSDRMHALNALLLLSDSRETKLLDLMRERALDSLVEMARWKTPEHALPAFVLTGRLAGIDEQKIQDAWAAGNREPVLSAALALTPNKRKTK